MKNHYFKLLILIVLGLFAMRTFWGPEWYDGHDSQAHIVRLHQFDKAIKQGQLPPRWAPDLYAGRGYPVFIFAYPLPYFAAESFHLVGFDFAVSLKLTIVLAYLVSIVGMYFLAGFTGAVLWAFAPYIFVKIFITGSLGVVMAFAFIPWFFYAIKRRFWFAAVFFLAAWVLSHPGKLVIFAPITALFFIDRLKHWRELILVLVFGLGLSAWYFLPANLELPYTHFKDFVSNQYANDFVSFSRLLYSRWGTNAPGWGANPLSQQVGVAQWLAVGLGLIFWKKTWPYLLVFALSIFLMLEQSKFIWDLPTPLQQVSTPWRFLSGAVFTSALAGATAIKSIQSKSWRNLAAGLLIVLALYGNRNHMRINDTRVYDQEFFDNYVGVATGWNEHLPIWVKNVDYDKADSQWEVIENNHDEVTVRLNTLYYPGWQVKVDGKPVTIESSDNGLIIFRAPVNFQSVSANFGDTPLRRTAKLISLVSFLVIIAVWINTRFRWFWPVTTKVKFLSSRSSGLSKHSIGRATRGK